MKSAGWTLLRTAFDWRQAAKEDALVTDEGSRAFDIADDMEAGTARESTADFTTPLRKSGRLWRFRLLRSVDRMEARLVTESGDFLMYARVHLAARIVAFHLYDPAREEERTLFNQAAPAFTLNFNEAR